MAVTLNTGESVNTCDSATGFGTGGADTDIFVEGTASIGAKTSNTTNDFVTTSLGATAPYNFSGTGGESGDHIIIWMNGLTPLNSTTGMRIRIEDQAAGDAGVWQLAPPSGYTGGFVPKVIDTAADFDVLPTGAWTLTGNPGQLTNIDAMGGGFTTTTTIMGNFNNVLIDHFTIGTGLRADGGSTTTPNTWETIRAADEGGTLWGWVTSAAGGFVIRGGIYLGPATGTATSVFNDTAAVVLFSAEEVAVGFYDINIRGTGTDVDFVQNIIRAEDTTVARWSLTLDGTSVPTFDDDSSLFQGFDTITLQSGSTLSGTTLDDGNSIVQNSGSLDSCTILNANTADGTALITSDDLTLIQDCEFNFSDGHALELTSAHAADPTEHTFQGNLFNGYAGTPGSNLTASSGSTDAAIYNNSGKDLIINITGGGDTPSVRNGASATTVINNNVNVTVTVVNQAGDALPGVEVSVYQDDAAKTVIISSTSTDENGQVTGSAAASTGVVVIRARQSTNIATFATTSGVDGSTETITTDANHHFQNGDSFTYDKDGGSAAIGLTDQTVYYAGNVTANTLEVYDTAANAIAGGATGRQDLTASGSETHLLDPIRFVAGSASGNIGTGDFSATVTLITDSIATG